MLVLGLDISTHMGIALMDEEDGEVEYRGVFHVPRQEHHEYDRYQRWALYQRHMAWLCTRWHERGIRLAVIEGYSYTRNSSSTSTLIEVGSTVRMELYARDIPWIEVPPATLKKFVTGRHDIKKNLMLKEVYKRWGVDLASDDEADAYALAQFGMYVLGVQVGKKVPKKQVEGALVRYRANPLIKKLLT